MLPELCLTQLDHIVHQLTLAPFLQVMIVSWAR